jgi:glycosyltransferase involved in cell wall biosynthesis
VVIAVAEGQEEDVRVCQDSVQANTPEGVSILTASATAASVNRAIEQIAAADVVLLSEPCCVTGGWLERLRGAALADSNNATASAFSDAGTPLALCEEPPSADNLGELADRVRQRAQALRPRLLHPVGPCVYLTRAAVQLIGRLDEGLDLQLALEVDFAQRCLLSGLAHVAADDVVVAHLSPGTRESELPRQLRERYPYLLNAAIAASGVLPYAIELVRQPRTRLWVTIDARALEGIVTGTQVHILELIRALAHTDALRLRVLVRHERIDRSVLELLQGLPETELLAEDDVDERTPRSTVFHRPQQTFAAEDVAIALQLGEHVVLSQLDLIAYHNPGYFPDGGAWKAYRRASRHGMAAAERVVVFSHHTREELVRDALVEEQRIRIIPPGLDHRGNDKPTRPQALTVQAEEPGLGPPNDERFLLCLGTDFRHKNRIFALRLLAALHERNGWEGRLVFAGTHVPYGSSQELEHAVLEADPQLRGRVVELGSVGEAEKDWLMEHAAAVVYPSAYEGFGLVPFESAIRGVPCLFASQSSLAEIAPPEAAPIVPWDPILSAQAAHALLSEPGVRSKQVQALAGLASELTWARTATAMVETYREAAAAPVRAAATVSRDAADRERELTATFNAAVDRLIAEREHETHAYDELKAEVGPAQSLIGPHGTLPENLQRALLALGARPALSRPLLGALASVFVAIRAPARVLRRMRRRDR